MSGPNRDNNKQRQAASPGASPATPTQARPPIELSKRPRATLATIRSIVREEQHENFNLLAELATALTDAERKAFLDDELHTLKRVPGDVALDVAEVLQASLETAVGVAFAGANKVSPSRLRRHLAPKKAVELAKLRGDHFQNVKNALDAPLLEVLPTVAQNLHELAGHLGFITWLVESAPSGVVAQLMYRFGSQEMAKTLNTGKLWSWVDHVTPATVNEELAKGAKDPRADRLKALAPPQHATRWEMQLGDTTTPPLEEVLAGKTTVHQILAAIGKEKSSTSAIGDRAIRELQRLNVSADELLSAFSDLAFDRKLGLRALLSAPGATSQHVVSYLAQVPADPLMVLGLLADDALRAGVRRLGIKLHPLVAALKVMNSIEALLANDAVARWFVDEAGPNDLLELIGGDPASAPKAARYVAAKYPDWAWVWKLTSPSGSEQAMRVLAMNCTHVKATEYIRDVLLGDVPADLYKDTKHDNTVHPIDGAVYGAEQGRFDAAMKDGSADDVMARLADMRDGDRVKLGRSREFAAQVGVKVGVDHYARAAYLLGLRFGDAIHGSPEPSTLLLSYLATRPATEELAALNEWELVQRAHTHVNKDVLRVFPSLQQPAVLAKALDQNVNLVRLLLEESDPSRVFELLGHAEIRPKVDAVLQFHPTWLAKIPHYEHLSKPGRDGFDRLSRGAPKDGEVRTELDEAKEPEGHRAGKDLHDAREHKTLQGAIRSLLDENASPTAMLALLEERRLEMPKLLSDPTAWVTIRALAKLLDVPPDVACPWISRDALFGLPNALWWWLNHRDGSALLHSLYGSDRGRTAVARELDLGANSVRDWLKHLPVGAALSDLEEQTLLQLSKPITNVEVLRELFRVMYSIPLPPSWDEKHVRATFDTVSRLPSAHLQQERVRTIVLKPQEDGTTGQWKRHEDMIELSPSLAPGASSDTLHPADRTGWFTAQEMQRIYGIDERSLTDKVASGDVQQLSFAVPLYRPRERSEDMFASTLLHEFGHAVDDILGAHTPPVFDYAGWREYSDFDAWATEMGGWERVASHDREKIRSLIIDAKKSGASPLELAPRDHPIRAPQYKDVAVVKTALSGTTFAYQNRVAHRGRTFTLVAENRMFSLDAKAAATAPSDYSLKTPSEYFAESYVEYYIRPSDKGGMLAAPVKDWFTRHVDTMRYDPRRMKGGPP